MEQINFWTNAVFWEKLLPKEQEIFCKNSHKKRLPKHTMLHKDSSDCSGLVGIIQGEIRVYITSDEGREITLYRLKSGDICVFSASCVLDSISFDVSIMAEEDTEIVLFSSAMFMELSQKNIYLKSFGYELATKRFSDAMWALQQILFMRADKRLAYFLWEEYLKTHNTELCFTHEQVAQRLGSAREVITRLLKYFVQENIVELQRGKINLKNVEKLKKLL